MKVKPTVVVPWDFSTHAQAELVVMSTHGRTGLKKLFMGSVAQRVIEKSSCPVTILPAKWIEAVGNQHEDISSPV
jgi:nucleotide-binding universal stress UspA family protein